MGFPEKIKKAEYLPYRNVIDVDWDEHELKVTVKREYIVEMQLSIDVNEDFCEEPTIFHN